MSTVDQIQRVVLDDLVRGDLAPGSRIRQDRLAARLGVSKIPVREALQRLSASGLLQFETNRGASVPSLSPADAVENFTLRRAVEVELLRQAVPSLTIVDLARAEHALSHVGASPTEANWQFHRALYAPSGWNRGLAIAEMLHAAMAPYVLLYLNSLGGETPSEDEHRALLGACRTGDAEMAVSLLERHLDGAASAVTDFLRLREPDRSLEGDVAE